MLSFYVGSDRSFFYTAKFEVKQEIVGTVNRSCQHRAKPGEQKPARKQTERLRLSFTNG